MKTVQCWGRNRQIPQCLNLNLEALANSVFLDDDFTTCDTKRVSHFHLSVWCQGGADVKPHVETFGLKEQNPYPHAYTDWYVLVVGSGASHWILEMACLHIMFIRLFSSKLTTLRVRKTAAMHAQSSFCLGCELA